MTKQIDGTRDGKQVRTNRSICSRIADRLIRTGPDQAGESVVSHRTRLLGWTVFLLFMAMVFTIAVSWLSESDAPDRRLLYVAIPFVYALVLVIGFILLRRQRCHAAALLTVLGGAAAVWTSVLLDEQVRQGPDIVPLFYMALCILLASFLLSSWETGLLAVLQMGGLVWLLQHRNAWTELNWPSLFTFLLIVTLLSLGISKIMQADLRQIEWQNRLLLENETALKELAIRDALTGLFNRHYLEETLPREISRVARRNSTLGIIMIDIDRFKAINDQYGHAVGDEFLKAVGANLAGKVRESDIACRYGGDEYVLIMPDASLPATRERAENIRVSASAWQIRIGSITIDHPSLSCGVAAYPENGPTGAAVLKAADDALYLAKQNGRNRTETAVAVQEDSQDKG